MRSSSKLRLGTQDDDSNVVGVLTRDSVLRAIDAAKRGRFESVSDYDGE